MSLRETAVSRSLLARLPLELSGRGFLALLRHVRQLVRQQPFSCRGARRKLTGAEDDVMVQRKPARPRRWTA